MAETRAPAAAAGAAGKRRRWPRRLAVAALALAVLLAVPNLYLLASARGRVVATAAAAPPRPVAIVLGNKVYPNGAPSLALAERLRVALELYRLGRVERVIVSGAVRPGYDEPRAMARWLVVRGLPEARITRDAGGHRTAASMANAAAAGVVQALVCTQAYHLPRALYLARHAGIDAVGVAASDERWYGLREEIRNVVRESLARAEVVVEVALRCVRR